MQAAEKRKLEQDNLKAERISHIIECTYKLFSEKGFDIITMNEIADQSEIGVASLYRYFSTKDDLAIECAIFAWQQEITQFNTVYLSPDYAQRSGLEQLRCLLEVFPKMLTTQGNFFRFVYYFDAYIKRQKVSPERLSKYEGTIVNLKSVVTSALEKGQRDGSICFRDGNSGIVKASDDELYFTITHALFSTAQKLSLSGEMLTMDTEVPAVRQIELLIGIITESLKNK